ncbi:MAG: MFS transporter [Nitrososphaeria archaeon]|jgi:MFS family permease
MDRFKISSELEETRWTKVHWWIFASFSVGMILEGYSFALSSVVSTWFTLPVFFRVLAVMWSSLWLAVGVIIFGPIADRIGRKKSFYISMSIFAIAGILIIATYNYFLSLLSVGLLAFAGGAEQNVIMTAMHEYYPRKHRNKAYMITLDTIEIGSIISGIVASFSFSSSPAFSKEVAGILVLIIVGLLVFIRYHMPESIRWLEASGKSSSAENEARKYFNPEITAVLQEDKPFLNAERAAQPLPEKIKSVRGTIFRFVIALILAETNTVTYGLVTYTLGPVFYPELVPEILMIGTLAAFFGGFLGLGADRWSKKKLLVLSYFLSMISFLLLYAFVPLWSKNLSVFWGFLILAEVWPQLAWESADSLKSEIWPTTKRGTFLGLNRGITFLLSIPFLYIGSTLTLSQYMLLNVVWWVSGLAAAIVWYIWGVESGKGVSIAVPSGEA